MNILPFHQGELDGLCGLYAIVNATRLAMWPSNRMKSADCKDFFEFLVACLHKKGMLFTAMTNGMSPRLVSKLLRQSDHWLKRNYDVRLRIKRLRHLKPDAPRIRVVVALASHLRQPNTAALVAVECGHAHWTVVRKVAAGSLLMFDSAGMKRISLAYTTRRTTRLPAHQAYLLTCQPASNCNRASVS
jgi:hypothetical protein